MTMPNEIKTDQGTFYLTEWRGTSLEAAPFNAPVGTKTYEYWHSQKGDAVRLYAISPTEYVID